MGIGLCHDNTHSMKAGRGTPRCTCCVDEESMTYSCSSCMLYFQLKNRSLWLEMGDGLRGQM